MIKMNKYFNSNGPSKILRIHRYALLKQIIYFKRCQRLCKTMLKANDY